MGAAQRLHSAQSGGDEAQMMLVGWDEARPNIGHQSKGMLRYIRRDGMRLGQVQPAKRTSLQPLKANKLTASAPLLSLGSGAAGEASSHGGWACVRHLSRPHPMCTSSPRCSRRSGRGADERRGWGCGPRRGEDAATLVVLPHSPWGDHVDSAASTRWHQEPRTRGGGSRRRQAPGPVRASRQQAQGGWTRQAPSCLLPAGH